MKKRLLASFTAVLLAGLGFASAAAQQADTIQDKLLVQKFKAANASYEKAKALYQKQKFAEAERHLDECLARMPEHNEAHFLKAQIAYRAADLERALEHAALAEKYFHETVKILARHQVYHMEEVDKLGKQNEETIAALKDQLSRTTDAAARAKILQQIGEQERQLSIVRDRLKNPVPLIDQIPAEYPYFHGNILFKMKRFEEAEQQYLKAVELDALHLNAYTNLANIYYMAGMHERALEIIEKAEGLNLRFNPELKKAVLKALGR